MSLSRFAAPSGSSGPQANFHQKALFAKPADVAALVEGWTQRVGEEEGVAAGLVEAVHDFVAVEFPSAGEPDRALASPSANASAVDPSSSP